MVLARVRSVEALRCCAPSEWGKLSRAYAACRTGKSQSPINLWGYTGDVEASLEFKYNEGAVGMTNTGHAIQLNFPAGNSVRINGVRYDLLQMHFHVPAEHRLNGERFPMEAHFVHKSAAGGVAVIAVMYEQGAADPHLAQGAAARRQARTRRPSSAPTTYRSARCARASRTRRPSSACRWLRPASPRSCAAAPT